MRVKAEDMKTLFRSILVNCGMVRSKAEICARIFTENSLDGVYTHGVNRFPRFVRYIKKGYVDVDAEAEKVSSAGSLEQWNGHLGPGILNALTATKRAMTMASESGMGCVALANTNHWMRGGTYGWKAAKAGFVFIGWTNALKSMPAWGAVDVRLGNNPLVLAVPYKDEAIVLDMALSQYSVGRLEAAAPKGDKLPLPGGYNTGGELSVDPQDILDSGRTLPIGYWKGAGMALLFDLIAAILSGGDTTVQISQRPAEIALSQVFIAFDPRQLSTSGSVGNTVSQVIDDLHQSVPATKKDEILFPGESVLRRREENSRLGIPVNERVWEEILGLRD